jgi:hypothetical protein
VDASLSGAAVLVNDLIDADDPAVARWPTFASGAVDAGVLAAFAFPLLLGTARIGALSLYRNSPGALSSEQLTRGLATADSVALTLADKGDGLPAPDQADPLRVHQAAGMAMVQLGVPIDQGHAARLYKPEQKRAIQVRDGGCGNPGCDAPWEWCQIHHVEEWDADDGPTDQANGLPACGFHHTLWHSKGWTVTPDPDTHHLDQGFIITNPDGDILRSQRHGQTRPLVIEMGLDQAD